ncbi:MAG: hypothetical protein L0Y66_09175 [Myxococcaceae bacterium]|nr:hypothetical protein [Myxococcaceae bacterium]MCI0670400.1 hypothetical protein [Myxococcaceae bacterium]
MSIQKDYIERLIERLVAALAAILKLGKSQKPEEALQKLHEAGGELFGLEYRVLRMMDAASVARVLDLPEKVEAFAQLVAAEAEVLAQSGDTAAADRCLTDALTLLDEAQRLRGTPVPRVEALRAELRARQGQLPDA